MGLRSRQGVCGGMEYKDYYKIMGVARDASAQDIKRAHRRLARRYHPDVSQEPDAEARFKDISEAYEVLRDPHKRAAYDQLGPRWQAGQDFRPPPDWNAGQESPGPGSGAGPRAGDADFSDFFDILFGRSFQGAGFASGPRGARAGEGRRGEDHHARILIDLRDAYTGATRSVRLRRTDPREPGRSHEHEIRFEVPRGVRAGQRIRLPAQGGSGAGRSPPGDLYLEVDFQPPPAGQPAYRVDRHDVYLDLPVAPWEAALGAKVRAPTPTGWVELTIPPNSPSGRKLRLKGRGLPAATPGDFYFVLQVVAPAPDNEARRQAYRELAVRFQGHNPRAAWQEH